MGMGVNESWRQAKTLCINLSRRLLLSILLYRDNTILSDAYVSLECWLPCSIYHTCVLDQNV